MCACECACVHVCGIIIGHAFFKSGSESDGIIAGISNWKGPIKQADGDSITLFDHKPDSSDHRCDPIADAYAVIARPNNAILAVASGCNLGAKSQQAARCAVRGCIEKLNETLLSDSSPKTTQQVVSHILSSFTTAQEMITKHEGMTASLCVAVICRLHRHWGEHEWGLSVVSVGKISCFVWKNGAGTVHEVMSPALHDVASTACLGPSQNGEPDLGSPVCSYVHVSRNDVVFLATRGIYDNFDPFVLLDEANEEVGMKYSTIPASNQSQSVPLLTEKGKEKRRLSLLSELLKNCRAHRKADHLSALALKEAIIGHVVTVTEKKRNFLEKNWQDMKYAEMLTDDEKAAMEKRILQLAEEYPGFLGHATIAAYQVGHLTENASHDQTKLFLYSPTIDFETAEVEEDRSVDT